VSSRPSMASFRTFSVDKDSDFFANATLSSYSPFKKTKRPAACHKREPLLYRRCLLCKSNELLLFKI
jgi:hypothetical protein